MALIKLEVTIEELGNTDLEGLDMKLYKFLNNPTVRSQLPFGGLVTDVTESDREEDEDNGDNA